MAMSDEEKIEAIDTLVIVSGYVCSSLGAQHIVDIDNRDKWEQLLAYYTRGVPALLEAWQAGLFKLQTGVEDGREVTDLFLNFETGWKAFGRINGPYAVDEELVEKFRSEIPDSPDDDTADDAA
jgi:hypothetical protein